MICFSSLAFETLAFYVWSHYHSDSSSSVFQLQLTWWRFSILFGPASVKSQACVSNCLTDVYIRHPISTFSSIHISHVSFSYHCPIFFLIWGHQHHNHHRPDLKFQCCPHFPLYTWSDWDSRVVFLFKIILRFISFYTYLSAVTFIHFLLISCLNQWNSFLGSSQMHLSFLFNQFSMRLPAGSDHPKAVHATDASTLLLC